MNTLNYVKELADKLSRKCEQLMAEDSLYDDLIDLSTVENNIGEGNSENITREKILQEKDLYELLSLSSSINLSLRDMIDPVSDLGSYKDLYFSKCLNIHIEELNENEFKITLNPLADKKYKGSYDIYYQIKLALNKYLSYHKFNLKKDRKYILVYKRYSVNIKSETDNDNWEMKRATNAITECVSFSDSPSHLSFVYTTVPDNKNYVEIYFLVDDEKIYRKRRQ